MNPRQRRGALLVTLSGVLGVIVFVLVLGYVAQVRRQVGDLVPVLELKQDVPAYTSLTPSMLETVMLPQRWTSATAVASYDSVSNLVTATAVGKGSYLEKSMLTEPPELKDGQREIAILIDAETGVAGKVHAGDIVDIYGTFAATGTGPTATQPVSRIIVSHALVTDIGQLVNAGGSDGKGNFSSTQQVPVTFALSVHDSLVLTYAESFAVKVRLARLSPTDQSTVPADQQIVTSSDADTVNGFNSPTAAPSPTDTSTGKP